MRHARGSLSSSVMDTFMMASSNENITALLAFVRGIHRSPVDSPHKGHWRGSSSSSSSNSSIVSWYFTWICVFPVRYCCSLCLLFWVNNIRTMVQNSAGLAVFDDKQHTFDNLLHSACFFLHLEPLHSLLVFVRPTTITFFLHWVCQAVHCPWLAIVLITLTLDSPSLPSDTDQYDIQSEKCVFIPFV